MPVTLYVWLNGEQLIQGHDYTVSRNIITVTGRTITSSDRIDVMYFAVDTAVTCNGIQDIQRHVEQNFLQTYY